MSAAGDGRYPLSALLSQALVAFIIEFDNEFEHRTPHRTTNYGATTGEPNAPWLVSMVMWSMFLRYIPDEGILVKELRLRARCSEKAMQQWLTRLSSWWGYLTIESPGAAGASKRILANSLVRPTAGGRNAIAVWRPLTGLIESRWQERFGKETVDRLRNSLILIASQLGPGLPDVLPILGYGLFSREPDAVPHATENAVKDAPEERSLHGLLSTVLLAFAVEFERESPLSLAIAANALRFDDGARVRDLPRLAGVSKEAIATAVSFLEGQGHAVVEVDSPGSRVKVLTLTAKGRLAQQACGQLVGEIEERWRKRLGGEALDRLRKVLEQLAGGPGAKHSPLMGGLQPYPDCWRASIPAPEVLPHFPMILHRGGFPDGS
jgi:DNA-binding MarR family transcriptional regulator